MMEHWGFPQIWNTDRIMRNPKGFIRDFSQEMGADEAKTKEIATKLVQNQGSMDFDVDLASRVGQYGRIFSEGGAGRSSFEHSRKIHIPEKSLPIMEKWLVNSVEPALTRYFRNGTRRVEYARRFGPNEELLNAKVLEAIEELDIGNNPQQIRLLTKQVYDLADAMMGKFRPIESINTAKWNRRIANFEVVAHLPWVSLASFPEYLAPGMQFGFRVKPYAKSVLYAANRAAQVADRFITGKKHIHDLHSAAELKRLGEIHVHLIESAAAQRFNTIGGAFTNKFMHYTGLEFLTDTQRFIAYETIQEIIKENTKYLRSGKGGKRAQMARSQLMELGIDPANAVKGEISNYERMVAGGRGQRWAVTNPNPATRPLVFSHPAWQNVMLFKSFTGVFTNLFLKRAGSKLLGKDVTMSHKAGMIGTAAASVAIAYYTQFFREWLTGERPGKSG